jgi:hypothetical protein
LGVDGNWEKGGKYWGLVHWFEIEKFAIVSSLWVNLDEATDDLLLKAED